MNQRSMIMAASAVAAVLVIAVAMASAAKAPAPSKGANDADIAHRVIAMKGELEKFREQLENLE